MLSITDYKTKILKYLFPFLLGGFTVSGIKYVASIASPAYAALIGTFPIGYLSTYYILSETKRKEYLVNYNYSLATIIIAGIAYIYFLNLNIDKNLSLVFGCILIGVLSFIRLKFFPSTMMIKK